MNVWFLIDFPVGKVVTISFMSFSMNFGTMMLISFLPFMVSDFFPEYSREELGWLTCYISSAYFLGSFCGGIIWGRLADIWGRRPGIFLATIESTIFMILFGLSRNFWWALFTRFLWGVGNGAVGVYKTYISEVLNNNQQSVGFSIFGVATALGTLLGPVIGGFLSQPANKYPAVFHHPFFCDYPFILPIFVLVILNLISLIAFVVFVTESLNKNPAAFETNKKDKLLSSDSDSDAECDSSLPHKSLSSCSSNGRKNYDITSSTKQKPSRSNCYSYVLNLMKEFVRVQRTECILCFTCPRATSETGSSSDSHSSSLTSFMEWARFITKVLLDRRVVLTIIIFVAIGGIDLVVLEIFILLMVSDEDHGGFMMSENNIGFIFMIIGISEIFFIFIFFPLFVKLLGYRALLAVSLVGLAASTFFIPWNSFLLINYVPPVTTVHLNESEIDSVNDFCSFTNHLTSTNNTIHNDVYQHNVLIWITVSIAISFVSITRMFSRVAAVVLVNNSSVSKTKGTINGVAQSFMSLSRGLSHFCIILIFAWSQNNSVGVWPLNYHFTFIICATLMLLIIPFVAFLPPSIEEKRTKL